MQNHELYTEIQPADLDLNQVRPWIRQHEEADESNPNLALLDDNIAMDLTVWVEHASPHPVTPPMTSDEFRSLELSICEHGVQEGVVYMNQLGDVVDGYHRTRAIHKLRIEGHALPMLPIRILRFRDRQAENLFVVLRNLTRRHLTLKQRREAAIRLLRAGHEGTDNHVAELCGLSGDTVKALREDLENLPADDGGIEKLPVRKSKDGRKYRVKKEEQETSRESAHQAATDAIVDEPASLDNVTLPHPVEPPPAAGVVDEVEDKTPEDEMPKHPSVFNKMSGEAQEIWAFLEALVEVWWDTHQFRPVYGSELIELIEAKGIDLMILGDTPKRRADNFAKLLAPFDVRSVGGRYIYRRPDKNGTSLFTLSPDDWSPFAKN